MIPKLAPIQDLIIIGAGPTGLACAIEAETRGLDYRVIEKGCIVNSIKNFPLQMTFFTTPELLEIGGLPFVTPYQKPTRLEALKYYRRVADTYRLKLRLYETVLGVEGRDGNFQVRTERRDGRTCDYRVRKIVLATGYYDIPNFLNVPGENLSKVTHYYREAHPYYGMDVAVIGGKNSAAVAALDLYRAGARVTLVHRGSRLSSSIKYWIKPDIENRIKAGEIKARFDTTVAEITQRRLALAPSLGRDRLPGQRLRIRHDRLSSRSGVLPFHRRSIGFRRSAASDRQGQLREQCRRRLPGRRGGRGHVHQRGLHRERSISW